MRELNLPIYREQIAEINADHASTDHPDAIADSETTQAVPAAVKAAREWLKIDYEDVPRSTDIFTIVKRCLKESKKLKCGQTVKMMTQLTAVSEYVKLEPGTTIRLYDQGLSERDFGFERVWLFGEIEEVYCREPGYHLY